MNSPAEVAENYLAIGTGKAKLAAGKMFFLAMMAGAFIALAGMAASTASSVVDSPSLARLVSGCVFPGGLAMVLLAGSELFTGNCLMVIPLLSKRITVAQMLRNWVIVYIGNLAGALLVAAIVGYSHLPGTFSGALALSEISTAASKCSLGFGGAFLRGIACNFLVCIAVWISFAAKDVAGKLLGLFFPIMLFVISGFEHSVADMFYIPIGLFVSTIPEYAQAATEAGVDLSVLNGGQFIQELIPITLGNIVGGMAVGIVYWYCYLKDKKA